MNNIFQKLKEINIEKLILILLLLIMSIGLFAVFKIINLKHYTICNLISSSPTMEIQLPQLSSLEWSKTHTGINSYDTGFFNKCEEQTVWQTYSDQEFGYKLKYPKPARLERTFNIPPSTTITLSNYCNENLFDKFEINIFAEKINFSLGEWYNNYTSINEKNSNTKIEYFDNYIKEINKNILDQENNITNYNISYFYLYKHEYENVLYKINVQITSKQVNDALLLFEKFLNTFSINSVNIFKNPNDCIDCSSSGLVIIFDTKNNEIERKIFELTEMQNLILPPDNKTAVEISYKKTIVENYGIKIENIKLYLYDLIKKERIILLYKIPEDKTIIEQGNFGFSLIENSIELLDNSKINVKLFEKDNFKKKQEPIEEVIITIK